jgi:hypothetical protein
MFVKRQGDAFGPIAFSRAENPGALFVQHPLAYQIFHYITRFEVGVYLYERGGPVSLVFMFLGDEAFDIFGQDFRVACGKLPILVTYEVSQLE